MSNNKPIYKQLADNILNKIETGEYRVGEAIMSEREMANKYDINRLTVRRAIESLKEIGLLESIQGKGTIVTSVPRVTKNIEFGSGQTISLSKSISQSGYESNRKVLSLKQIKSTGKLLKYFELNEQIYELIRLSYIDGIPYALQLCYFPSSVYHSPERYNFEETSIYTYMATQGCLPKYFQTIMIADFVSNEYRNLLNITENEYVFHCNYVNYGEKYEILEYTDAYYLPKYTTFKYVTRRQDAERIF